MFLISANDVLLSLTNWLILLLNSILRIEAIYSLTNIAHFDKLKSKSSDIDIRMAPDNKPIGLIYNIPQFGQFIVFISAIMQDI